MSKNYPIHAPDERICHASLCIVAKILKDFFHFFPLLHAWIFSWDFLRNNGCAGKNKIVGEIFVN